MRTSSAASRAVLNGRWPTVSHRVRAELVISPVTMSLKIARILHAGYIFEKGGVQVAFDPIFENPFSRNCHAFPQVQFNQNAIRDLRLDAVFISHYHDDHCSLESLDLLNRETPIYMYCHFDELFTMVRALGFTEVHSLRVDVGVQVGEIEIIPRRALDADVDVMFHVRTADLNVLNVVDSWIDSETLEQLSEFAPWDVVLWPFQTMRELEVLSPRRASVAAPTLPTEWIAQLRILRPKSIVPSSCQFKLEDWSWYNRAFFPISYRQFKAEIEASIPASRVLRLDPGCAIELSKESIEISKPIAWIRTGGDADSDYDYRPMLPPPSTAEVARRFPALDEKQIARVDEYCQVGLLEKYRSMDPTEQDFFTKARVWKLSLYDHDGLATEFFYRIEGARIERISDDAGQFSWQTEVPISKLYAALEDGETLTSMYVRINDLSFSSEIEDEISEIDVVEDPLIRCLFNGVFGSYQTAQLARIRNR